MNSSITICPLSSGSSGNCILVRTKDTTIVVDCGLTGKAFEKELSCAGIAPEDVDAIIVTHEHIDHIKGVGIISRRFNLPIYATLGTWKGMIDSIGKIDESLIHYISPEVPFLIKDTPIFPFATSHDAQESIGLVFSSGDKKGGIVTDLGVVTKHLYDLLKQCEILVIEANHDENMLVNGAYPQNLKERILSDCGHLSNRICGAFCAKLVREGCTRQIMLGHLSSDNNTPRCAYGAVCKSIENAGFKVGKDVLLYVANRSCISEKLEV